MTVGETSSTPRISVVICTRNRHDQIERAVSSVLANDYPAFDLTVVDQSTSGETREIIEALQADDARLHYLHSDLAGLSRAYNTGIDATENDVLAFTDDDCVAGTDWLASIAQAFSEHPDAGLLYGEVVAFGETADDIEKTPSLTFDRSKRVTRDDGFLVAGMGANFAARRSLFEEVGPFDTVLGGGGPLRSSQDFDLVYRALIADCVVLLWKDVSMRHDGRREADEWPALLNAYGTGEGAFYTKHIRCGDVRALWLLTKGFSRHSARWVKQRLQRDEPVAGYFLSGLTTGVRRSFEFKVDRSTRLYIES